MLTNLKLCGGVVLLLSALVIAPTEAKPISEVNSSSSYEIAQLDNNEAVYKVTYPVGIVRTLEGDTVMIELKDGVTQSYQMSSDDMKAWKLTTGSYVLVDQEKNKILDVVYEGEVKSIVGSVVTVQLKDGKLEKYGLDRGTLGAMSLVEGQDVYVTKSSIVALAPEPDVDKEASSINTNYQPTQAQPTQMPTKPLIESNKPQQTETYQQPTTTNTQTNTQETQADEPVRGMW